MDVSWNDALEFINANSFRPTPLRCEPEVALQVVSLWKSIPCLVTDYISFCRCNYPSDRTLLRSVNGENCRIPIHYEFLGTYVDEIITTLGDDAPKNLFQFSGKVRIEDCVFKSFGHLMLCFVSETEGQRHTIAELGQPQPSVGNPFTRIEVNRFTIPALKEKLEKQISFELELRGIGSRDFMHSSQISYWVATNRQDLWTNNRGIWPNCVLWSKFANEFPSDAQRVYQADLDVEQLINKLFVEISQSRPSETSNPQSEPPPLPVEVPPSPYKTLWDYAKKMWAADTDKFKICQHIWEGPGNYSDCVEGLIPGVKRSIQTTRFHSVLGSLNPEIGTELGLEVYRLGEQVLICGVGQRPIKRKPKSKKTTTKKSTTKRKH